MDGTKASSPAHKDQFPCKFITPADTVFSGCEMPCSVISPRVLAWARSNSRSYGTASDSMIRAPSFFVSCSIRAAAIPATPRLPR